MTFENGERPFLGVGKKSFFSRPFMKISNFSKTVHTIFTKFSTVILHHMRVLYVQWHQNRMAGMWETAKISPKMVKKQSFFDFFSIFSKTVHTIRMKASQKEKDLSRFLYRICGSGFTPPMVRNMVHGKLGFLDFYLVYKYAVMKIMRWKLIVTIAHF